jgi:hypothetical protein
MNRPGTRRGAAYDNPFHLSVPGEEKPAPALPAII